MAAVALSRAASLLHEGLPPTTALDVAVPLVWLGVFVALLVAYRRGAVSPTALCGGAAALTILELFALGVGYHTTVSPARAAMTPPAIQAVQRDHSLYRVVGLGDVLRPSLAGLYGLQDVRGYDPAHGSAYEQYFRAIFAETPGWFLDLPPTAPNPSATRALDLMNVKYIFAACAVPLTGHPYRLIYRGSGCVYRNATALPRAFLVHDVGWATPARAAVLLGQGRVAPRSTVLLDPASPDSARESVRPGYRLPHGDAVEVIHYDVNAVELTVRSESSAILVLTDAFAPGWQADVDGRPTPILRADAVFRAVVVGPGVHRVGFTYDPESFKIGGVVSGVALLVWLLLLLRVLIVPFLARGIVSVL